MLCVSGGENKIFMIINNLLSLQTTAASGAIKRIETMSTKVAIK